MRCDAQAKAFLGFGGKSDEEVYSEDTLAIIAQMRVRAPCRQQRSWRRSPRAPRARCAFAAHAHRAVAPQATLALPKDDPAQLEAIARMRQLTNSVRARALLCFLLTARAPLIRSRAPRPSGWPSTAATAP